MSDRDEDMSDYDDNYYAPSSARPDPKKARDFRLTVEEVENNLKKALIQVRRRLDPSTAGS